MLGAIGTSTLASSAGVGKSAAGLEERLAQYEIQLSDWENCPSCTTPEGKAKIAELSSKVNEIKQRIAVTDANKEKLRATAPDLPASANGVEYRGDSAANIINSVAEATSSRTVQQTGIIGGRLDVFA
jgi:hypothetical protein